MKPQELNQETWDELHRHAPDRESLIPILQGIQKQLGYISPEALEAVARYLRMSENEIYGVATFYAQFRFARPGQRVVRVCRGTACHVSGSQQILDEVSQRLGIRAGETTADGKFSLECIACFGSCALAPVVVVDEVLYGRMTPRKVKPLLKDAT
jgi:NADH-quinone oxidoreductase subunit E